MKGGLRNFYNASNWSFLKPVSTLTLKQNTNFLQLPDDYGGHEGPITLAVPTGVQWWQLLWGSVGAVYQKQSQFPTTTGRPQIVCEEPVKGTLAQQGQRMRLTFWPIADQDYPIKFQYYLNPDYLSGAFPYAYGGAQHAETLLESCLAVAEKLLDDAATVHAMEFEKRLAVSKDIDARNKPENIGTNRDRSDYQDGYRRPEWRSWTPFSYRGVVY